MLGRVILGPSSVARGEVEAMAEITSVRERIKALGDRAGALRGYL